MRYPQVTSIDMHDKRFEIKTPFQPSFPGAADLFPLVVSQLGYPPGKAVSREVREEIGRAVQQGLELVRPLFLYRMTPFLSREKGVITGGDLRIHSAKWVGLSKRFSQPEVLCCFVVSIGQTLDDAISRLQEKALFDAYILDAVGSVLIEQLAEQMEGFLSREMAAKGYQSSARFSPGYCDWHIKQGQDELFDFLQPETVGITLTSAGMMLPRKSVSACMVGAREVPWKVPCFFCKRRDCTFRRHEEIQGNGG